MAYRDESFFTDEQIRDTNEHTSQMVYAGAFMPKTLLFRNELDAQVKIDVYGCSKENSSVHYFINTVYVNANTNDFATLEDYFQCFFLHVTAQTLPTTGGFWSEMLMTSGG